MATPVHWSLGFFKAYGYRLSVFCPNMHGAEIDIDVAIARFGEDYIVVHDRERFVSTYRCKVCGMRATETDLMAPNGYERGR